MDNVDDLTAEEKMDLLRRLAEEFEKEDVGMDKFGVEGEVTVRVLDENDEEKQVETETFKY